VLVTPEYAADEVFHLLSQAGEQVYTLGSVERVSRRVVFVEGGA
jgi:phosphoribosylaminoimidazole (AIR) synthetase